MWILFSSNSHPVLPASFLQEVFEDFLRTCADRNGSTHITALYNGKGRKIPRPPDIDADDLYYNELDDEDEY